MDDSQPNDREPKSGDLVMSPTVKLLGQPVGREPQSSDLVASPTMNPINIKICQFEYATIKKSVLKTIFQRFTTSSLEIQKYSGQAEYFQEDLGKGVLLDMMRIPAGEIRLGEADNPHQTAVPEFWMGKFVVTQAQWAAIAKWPTVNRDLVVDPSHFKGADRPVETVSSNDAIEFCDRLSKRTGRSYRLPSLLEWKYACQATTETLFHFGETISTDLANYNGTQPCGNEDEELGIFRGETINVGSFPANAFGLYDMHGNVWEWSMNTSYYDNLVSSDEGLMMYKNGSILGRTKYGGSWLWASSGCRMGLRAPVENRDHDSGFRVVYSQ
jgi:formylglycine-generating enzyme required for sulfatase activity